MGGINTNVTCTVCGENDFCLKEGYYYCNECGTKTEQLRALEVEGNDDFDEVKHKKTTKIKSIKSEKPLLTSWECYNYILRGLVEELLALGAKEELKIMVLQIWAAYLRISEVAFFSRKHPELPKLSMSFQPTDASILYNHVRERKKKREEKLNGSIASSKREWRRQVKKLDQSQYEASISQSVCSQSILSQLSLDTSCNSSGSAPSKRAIRLKFSSRARKQLKKRIPVNHLIKHEQDFNQTLTCHNIRTKKSDLKHKENLMDLSVKQLYAIITVALNLIEDDIQLSDFMRFVAEGHISSVHVEHFFPENLREHCKEMLAGFRFYGKYTKFSVTSMREQNSFLCKAIHIRSLKLPNMEKLVQRYVKELYLPPEICTYVERLMNLYPPQMEWDDQTFTPSYESRAMAYIIFTLKLFFGFDGRKEKLISKSARKLNSKLRRMGLPSQEELFVWDDWVEYIEMRKIILCNNNLTICKQFKQIPSRDLYLKNLCERSKLADRDLTKYQKRRQENMETTFQSLLQMQFDIKPEEEVALKYSPSFTPCTNYFKCIQLDPRKTANIPDFMSIDHSKRTLVPFLKPNRLVTAFAKSGTRLNVLRIECTNKRNPTGIFRNPDTCNIRKNTRKVYFDNDLDSWEARLNEFKSSDSIFKDELEKYCSMSMKNIKKRQLIKEDISAAINACSPIPDDISCSKSIDLFQEDDMDPADMSLDAPRRNLEKVSLFADISDDDVIKQEPLDDSQDSTATLKISNMDYWLLLGYACGLSDVQELELKNNLPPMFLWLLETCANTIGVEWVELYDQLVLLETFFAYTIEPLDQFEDRIVFKGENEMKDINKLVRHIKPLW